MFCKVSQNKEGSGDEKWNPVGQKRFVTCLFLSYVFFLSLPSAQAKTAVTIEYYALVDEQWHLVYTQNEADTYAGATQTRYYITPADLENAYGAFGFQAAQFNDDLLFPHTAANDPDTIWADTPPFRDAATGEWRVPLSINNHNLVFYLPNNRQGQAGYFTTKKSRTDAEMIRNNTFYSFIVSDPSGVAPSYSGKSYYFEGASAEVTLPLTEGIDWRTLNNRTQSAMVPDETIRKGDFITYRFHAIQHSIKITSASTALAYTIQYNANTLAANLQQLGVLAPSQQAVLKDGSVMERAFWQDVWTPGDDYTLRSPDSDLARVSIPGSSKNKKYDYRFVGWKLGDSPVILPANQPLSAKEIWANEFNGVLHPNAVWNGVDANTRVNSANFYVNLTCEIADNHDSGFIPQPESNFTTSLFTTSVYGTEGLPGGSGQALGYQLMATKDASNAVEIDKEIRALTTTPYQKVSFKDFPSDEDILAQLREKNVAIIMDGVTIPSELLTTAHFHIRWYVVKYEYGDGWHVDGILVASEAFLTVTKTFDGDEAALAQITSEENDYAIVVSHDPADETDNELTLDYILSLRPEAEETRENRTGYRSYDPASRTYTWVLGGHPLRRYTLKEVNYRLSGDWHEFNRYMISGASDKPNIAPAPVTGWQNYNPDEGVSVIAESYASDVQYSAYQTVAFQNIYTSTNVLTLFKKDSFSMQPMKDVVFTFRPKEGDTRLYRKPGTSEYAINRGNGYTEPVDGNQIVTDSSGHAYLRLAAGAYLLTEKTPEGYYGLPTLELEIDNHGQVTRIVNSDDPQTPVSADMVSGLNTALLTLRNTSELLFTVTARADWAQNTPTAQRAAVQVELWCDGQRVDKLPGSVSCRQDLSPDNEWTFTWTNLPLFIDGHIANYTLRETLIGSTAYDPEYQPSGYREYTVTFDPALYREKDEGEFNDPATWVDDDGARHYARHALLVVHNSLTELPPDETTITINGVKAWEGDEPKQRPSSITVELYADGQRLTSATVTPDERGMWLYSFQDLPERKDGRVIQYTVKEVAIPGYTAAVEGYHIINRYNTEPPGPTPTPTPLSPSTPTPLPSVSPSPAPSVTPSASPIPAPPRTGDVSALQGWLLGLLLSGFGLLACLYLQRKRS